jgi:hypothetical protein
LYFCTSKASKQKNTWVETQHYIPNPEADLSIRPSKASKGKNTWVETQHYISHPEAEVWVRL